MRNITLTPTIPYNVPPIIDITDQLPKKASWESIRKKYTVKGHWDGVTWHTGFRNPQDIDTIIIHHSGPPEGTLESHARYHASKWGGGISYHISIDKGVIKQCNDLLSFTYHAGDNNTYTVGIEVNRNLTKQNDLTDQERKLLYAAILTVKSLLPIKYIIGHNEVCPTACPVTSLDRIRKDVAALENEMEFNQTDVKKEEVAYRIVNELTYLYNMAKGKTAVGEESSDGQKLWARDRLLLLEPEMRKQGFLK